MLIEKLFEFIKLASVVFLGFSESLATKCSSLINQLCMSRPIPIDLNRDKHNHGLYLY